MWIFLTVERPLCLAFSDKDANVNCIGITDPERSPTQTPLNLEISLSNVICNVIGNSTHAIYIVQHKNLQNRERLFFLDSITFRDGENPPEQSVLLLRK